MKRVTIFYPYKFYGEFEDGHSMYAYGYTEEDAMSKLIDMHNAGKHGELTFYTCVNDENYVDGEYCPEEDRL